MYPNDEVRVPTNYRKTKPQQSQITKRTDWLFLQEEQDRLDIYHKIFLVCRNEELHRAPITPNHSTRILDLGTGTGIWAIGMAE